MSLDLRTLISFFTEFEHQVALEAPPGLLAEFPRNTSHKDGLAKLYAGYSECELEVFQKDFTTGLDGQITMTSEANDSITRYVAPAELGSFILNFDKRAEIFINDANKNGSVDKKILNPCYRRFLLMKEVFHVVLRDEFLRHEIDHPDTDEPEFLVTLLEELIYLRFSVLDFDNPRYKDAIKVEHAAELFATLSLYPLDDVAHDRKEFLESVGTDKMTNAVAVVSSTLEYAEKYMLPRRYVDLLFRWERFDELYALYRQLRKGY